MLVTNSLSGLCVPPIPTVSPGINFTYCEEFYQSQPCFRGRQTDLDSSQALISDTNLTLQLAVMLPGYVGEGSVWPYGYALQMAALMAQWEINFCSEFSNEFAINMTFFNSGCDQQKSAEALAEFIRQDGQQRQFFGMVGPGCSNGAADVARLVHFFDLGLISFGAEDSELSNRTLYPEFFRTSFSGNFQKLAWLHLLNFFKWTRVAMVRVNNRVIGLHASREFVKLFELQHGPLLYTYSQPENTFNYSTALDNLELHQARVVVALLLPDMTKKLLCAAYKRKVRPNFCDFTSIISGQEIATKKQEEKKHKTSLQLNSCARKMSSNLHGLLSIILFF